MAQTIQTQPDGNLLVVLPTARPVPVDEWENKERTGRQLRDRDSGLLLWEIACAADFVKYDRREADIVKVRYASETGEIPLSLYPQQPVSK